jgi:replicative DNA helicase
MPSRNLSEINDNVRTLKDTTIELQVPFILLCQLRRDTEKQNRPPIISDLKDSGQLEQGADRILMIDRPDLRNAHLSEAERIANGIYDGQAIIHAPKNREGIKGTQEQFFDGPYQEFKDPPVGASQDTEGVPLDLNALFSDSVN